MRAEVFHGRRELLEKHESEWRSLCERCTADEPFHRPQWIAAYAGAFEPAGNVVLATVRAGGALVGVLPLLREVAVIGGLPARRLRSAGNTHTCRYDLVHDPVLRGAVVEQVWHALAAQPGWDVLHFENVPDDGALVQVVRDAASAGYRTSVAPALTPPYLDLTPCEARFDRFAESLDSKFRSNLRRRRRKLETRGRVALSRSGVAGAIEQFYALEKAGWKGSEGSAIACNAATRRFYDAVAADAEHRGDLAFYTLTLDERPIAMYFGLRSNDRYYLLKTAYDESLRECSPGQLLTYDALRDLIESGCREFDFLGGMMDWKRDWAPGVRQLVDLHVFRGPAGRALHALHFQLRPAVGRAVRRLRGAR